MKSIQEYLKRLNATREAAGEPPLEQNISVTRSELNAFTGYIELSVFTSGQPPLEQPQEEPETAPDNTETEK